MTCDPIPPIVINLPLSSWYVRMPWIFAIVSVAAVVILAALAWYVICHMHVGSD